MIVRGCEQPGQRAPVAKAKGRCEEKKRDRIAELLAVAAHRLGTGLLVIY
jgi:hypothetical protein